MADLIRPRQGQVQLYDPNRGLKAVAVAEAGEKHWARAKDPAQLYAAIEAKLLAQAEYVVWRDGTVPSHGSHGGDRRSVQVAAVRLELPAADPGYKVVSRWRAHLCSHDDTGTVIDAGKMAAALVVAKARSLRACEFTEADSQLVQQSLSNEHFTPRKYIDAASANLGAIVAHHNRQTRDLDVSVHFNAFQRTDNPRGTEVLHRSNAAMAARVSRAMANAAGFINRGAKTRTDLSFLNRTNRPSILLELCFVDSGADATLYNRHFDDICRAIAESILDRPVMPSPSPEPQARPTIRQGDRGDAVRELQSLLGGLNADGVFGPLTAAAVRQFQTDNGLVADAIVGPRTWDALLAEDSNDGTT